MSDSASAAGRDAEHRAERDQAALLHAERARNDEGRAPDRLAEALDDEGFGEARRVAHKAERDPNLQRANEPDREMKSGAAQQRPAMGVKGLQPVVERIDRAADREPLAVAGEPGQKRLEQATPAPALRDIEAGERGRGERKADRGHAHDGFIAAEHDQHDKAERREQELRPGLNEHIDDDARRRSRSLDAVERQQPRADELAADLRERQEGVDPFPDVADQHADTQARPDARGKQQGPAHPRHLDREGARDHDRPDAPADARRRLADLAHARRRDQGDRQTGSDDEGENRQAFHQRSCRAGRPAGPGRRVQGRTPVAGPAHFVHVRPPYASRLVVCSESRKSRTQWMGELMDRVEPSERLNGVKEISEPSFSAPAPISRRLRTPSGGRAPSWPGTSGTRSKRSSWAA